MSEGESDQTEVGLGDGEFKPMESSKVQRILAVVGTAHVRGIVKEWQLLASGAAAS